MSGRVEPTDDRGPLPRRTVGGLLRRTTPGRHRDRRHSSAPLMLGLLVTVLLLVLGVGAALLPASFTGAGRGAGPTITPPVAAPGDTGTSSAGTATAGVPGRAGSAPSRSPAAKRPTPSPSVPADAGTAPRPRAKTSSPTRSKAQSTPTPGKKRSPTTVREDEVTELVNAERAKTGCGSVRTDERLRTASRGHSRDMADKGYFSHDGQDGSSPWDRAEKAGYPQAIGENIAKGQPTPADVMDAWMNSDGHRENVLNCDAKVIGVGLAYDGDGTPVWTQLFGAV